MNTETKLIILNEYINEISEIQSRIKKVNSILCFDKPDELRFKEICYELTDFLDDHIPDSKNHKTRIINYCNEGENWLEVRSPESVDNVKSVVKSLKIKIERYKSRSNDGDLDTYKQIELIINRFHVVANKMKKRYNDRDTLIIQDEYDVQDLFHSLLCLFIDDIRPEDWVPSYAGSASRVDFIIPEIFTVIETKMTRSTMNSKKLGEELIVDITKYKMHPQCKKLICFVYDPEGILDNPKGLENDLSDCDSDIDVKTIIVPKHK